MKGLIVNWLKSKMPDEIGRFGFILIMSFLFLLTEIPPIFLLDYIFEESWTDILKIAISFLFWSFVAEALFSAMGLLFMATHLTSIITLISEGSWLNLLIIHLGGLIIGAPFLHGFGIWLGYF